jgi:hypothetical protein
MALKSLEEALNYGTPDPKGALMDLSIIGVPEACQGRPPTITAYPRKFSATALKIWTEMIQDKEYQARTRVWGSLDLVWHNSIQEFLKRCTEAGVFPFSNNSPTAKNEYIQEFVRRSRIALVKYVDESGLMANVKVHKAFREYIRRDNGFTITSWANLYPLKEAAGDFEKFIQQQPLPRMLKQPDNRYQRVVIPHVRMWVRYINKARVKVGFDIEIAGNIAVPNKPLAKRKEVDQWIDNHILLPIIRSHRFKDVKTRLF